MLAIIRIDGLTKFVEDFTLEILKNTGVLFGNSHTNTVTILLNLDINGRIFKRKFCRIWK